MSRRMKQFHLPVLGLFVIAACTQQRAAPIDMRGDHFFDRKGVFDRAGNEVPKYNNRHRATLAPSVDERFVNDEEQTYGISAEVDSVGVSTLPPVDESLANESGEVQTIEEMDDSVIDEPVNDTPGDTSGLNTMSPLDKELYADDPSAVVTAGKQPDATISLDKETKDKVDSVIDTQDTIDSLTSQSVLPETAATPAQTAIKPDFVWPLRGKILDNYPNDSSGIAIAGREGEPVRAAFDGVIAHADNSIASFGNMVLIRHEDNYVTSYAHLSDMVVNVGDDVIKGELIGFVGKTGSVSEPQLYFSIRHNAQPVNALSMLPN